MLAFSSSFQSLEIYSVDFFANKILRLFSLANLSVEMAIHKLSILLLLSIHSIHLGIELASFDDKCESLAERWFTKKRKTNNYSK